MPAADGTPTIWEKIGAVFNLEGAENATILAGDQRDGCPIEPIATESVNASPLVRAASARAFQGWCTAIEVRLRSEGWSDDEAKMVALVVISLIEGALILSRIAGDPAALSAAKPAARTLLRG